MTRAHFQFRLAVLTFLSLTVLLLLTSALLGLQTAPQESPYVREERTVMRTQTLSASRGEIYDRNGVPLVTTVRSMRSVSTISAGQTQRVVR